MKSKIITVLLVIILLVGCTKVKPKEEPEKDRTKYQKYVKTLDKIKESSDDIPFNVEVVYDKISKSEIRYQVIIDKPKKDLKNIEAIATHDQQTDDIFPSIGVFDKKEKLLKDDKNGIILVGYIPYTKDIEDFECTVKLLIKYTDEEKSDVKYYIDKKEKISNKKDEKETNHFD